MTIPQLYDAYLASTGVSTDTRTLHKNNIYFALSGDNFDGNKFAAQALAAGASLAVIDNPEYETKGTVLVDNSLSALQELSKYHREQLYIPVIGLTGSNGKTTTKELVAAVLSTQYKVAYTKGNLNNHIGVPLTLLSISKGDDIAIIEMGANHQKEIEFLCSLCQPDFGYITNFGKAHLEGFGGIEGVIKGKSELYGFLRQHGKKVFVCADDKVQVEKSSGIHPITFGEDTSAHYQVKLQNQGASETIAVEFEGLSINSNLTGKYNFSNIGAAIAMGKYFGITNENVKNGIEDYIPQNNRSQIQRTAKNTLIVDTYNANPSSMEQALINFKDFPADHKWVILGDMFEMGEYELEEHRKIASLSTQQPFEKVILVGEAFAKVTLNATAELLQFRSTDHLIEYLQENRPVEKTILLKGSRGMKLERAIDLL